MRTILTNENNDIYLKSFGLAMAEDLEAVPQIVNNVLRTQLGEVSTDTTRGIPYLETVLGDNPDVDLWSSKMVEAIEGISYVQEVTSFTPQVDWETNTLTYTSKISTIYGEASIDGL